MQSFIIMQDTKSGGKAQQLPMAQAELPASWMLVTEVMIDQKGLVDEQSTRFEYAKEMWKDRSIQIEEDEDGVVSFLTEIRRMW